MENPFNEIIVRLGKIETKLEEIQIQRPIEEKFMSVQETAEFLGLARQTIYQLVNRNSIPSMKRAGRLYFSQKEVERWLKANRRISSSEASEIVDSGIRRS